MLVEDNRESLEPVGVTKSLYSAMLPKLFTFVVYKLEMYQSCLHLLFTVNNKCKQLSVSHEKSHGCPKSHTEVTRLQNRVTYRVTLCHTKSHGSDRFITFATLACDIASKSALFQKFRERF